MPGSGGRGFLDTVKRQSWKFVFLGGDSKMNGLVKRLWGYEMPGNGLNLRAGVGTVPLSYVPSTLLYARPTFSTLCACEREGRQGGAAVTGSSHPPKMTSLLQERFTNEETVQGDPGARLMSP